uniref:DUF4220 domain-containing protein n=1 Tax=Leersia perrieri TaxID=77586 RepID=A0A0D9VN19_9ORYZ
MEDKLWLLGLMFFFALGVLLAEFNQRRGSIQQINAWRTACTCLLLACIPTGFGGSCANRRELNFSLPGYMQLGIADWWLEARSHFRRFAGHFGRREMQEFFSINSNLQRHCALISKNKCQSGEQQAFSRIGIQLDSFLS